MNVLHIITEKKWRGGEQQIAYFFSECKQLNNIKVNHFVVCPPNSLFAQYCTQNGIPYFPLPLGSEFSFLTICKINNLLKNNRITLIHAHSSKALGMATLAQLFKKNKTPTILSRRVAFSLKNNRFNRFKYNAKNLYKIICVSQHALEKVVPVVFNKDKCTIIYDGVDLNRFQDLPKNLLRAKYQIDDRAPIVAIIAALEPEKDVMTFIKAAEIILKNSNQPVKFLIIGEGSQRHRLEREVSSHHLQDSIIFTGFIKDITTVLADIDILTITSKQEGLCSIALEAFAAHKPVVASNAAGINEIVIHNKTGLTASIGDAASFAKQITLFLQSAALTKQITHQAWNFVNTDHSIKKIAQETIDIYFKAIK